MRIIKVKSITDAFQVDAPFQWPMKTSEYLWYRKKTLAWRRLNKFQILNCFELCIAFLLSVLYSASSFLYAQFQIICLQYLKETPDMLPFYLFHLLKETRCIRLYSYRYYSQSSVFYLYNFRYNLQYLKENQGIHDYILLILFT